MSYKDILDNYTLFEINGVKYKIAYDNKAIVELQTKYDCGFFALAAKVDEIKSQGIDEILDFCLIGFKKHQDWVKKETIAEAQSYRALFEACGLELLRKAAMPDVFDEIVMEEKKKTKTKKGLTSIFSIT